MARYNEFLYDDIGNEYKRKNLYLLDVARLENKIEDSEGQDKARLKEELASLIKNKQNHNYNVKLNEFRKEEKLFLESLESKKKDFIKSLDHNISSKLKNLKVQLFECKEKINFYKSYVELTYDAQLEYEESRLQSKQLPDIINFLETTKHELDEALVESKKIDIAKDNAAKAELVVYKAEQKKVFEEGKKLLREKRIKRTISKKAEENGIIELKKRYNNAVQLKAFEGPKRGNAELIKSKRFELKDGTKRRLTVLKSNMADIRRKTPVEVDKTKPLNAYLTFLIPGLGQLLNKQYQKAALFSLATLFTYLIAIPYALGYGNYQGTGISGLISLARGGARIHKSLIFMIEGIIALFLVIIAAILLYTSFRDVLKVEKDKIRGIREKNWFEITESLMQEGFPYLVSFPALFLTVFIVLVPVATTVLISFTGMNPQNQSKFWWVAIENYKLIALGQGLAGKVFWSILGWTIVWTLLSTTLAIGVGFGLALLANNERVRFKGFFRTVYLLPWAVPAFITIMFFSIMFSPNGSLTQMISAIVGTKIEVKSNPMLTRATLIVLQAWLGSAYVFLLSTGVLQAIPSDLYEAADIDGATSWDKTRRITVPLVLFQTAPLLVTQYTFNFNNFSIIYLFNGGGPFNPTKYGNLAGTTDLLISYIYKLTIENQYQAIGAAITIFISLGLMLFAFIGFKNSKSFKEERL